MAAEIEQSITLTSFPPDTFNIADFGAVAGDTSILNTKAIEAAIMSCTSEEEGWYYVPADPGSQAR
jgi:polygalacturonase